MKKLDLTQALMELCKSTKKWGMLLSLDQHYDGADKTGYEEALKAAKCINQDDIQMLGDGYGILLGTKKEIEHAYELVVGDDGPTKLNPYNGPATVYALTCDSRGRLHNENT